MAKKTNSTTQEKFQINCIENAKSGHAIFQADDKRPPVSDMLPKLLSESVANWVKQRPEIAVRATLPLVKDGQTIAVHLWYEQR